MKKKPLCNILKVLLYEEAKSLEFPVGSMLFNGIRKVAQRMNDSILSLTSKSKRVALNNQTNTWKSDDRKAFFGTADEMLRFWIRLRFRK